jgi:hypothetical protein
VFVSDVRQSEAAFWYTDTAREKGEVSDGAKKPMDGIKRNRLY